MTQWPLGQTKAGVSQSKDGWHDGSLFDSWLTDSLATLKFRNWNCAQ
jgi:hypothetical protein